MAVITVRDVAEVFATREDAGRAFFTANASAIARACYGMALRFHRSGKLIVFGNGGATTDAQHVSVEFLHPVIVGKRALPAISLTNDAATLTGLARAAGFEHVFSRQLEPLAAPEDIAMGISADGNCANVLRALEAAAERGLLTVALVGGDGGAIAASPAVEHAFTVPSADPLVVKEIHVTLYHILWELVHVYFEQPGILEPGVVS